jgi:hypothetical protein
LLAAVIVGTISPSGKEVGPFLSIEQAILPQITNDRQRTVIFAGYNLLGSVAGARRSGRRVAVLFSLSPISGYRLLIWGYVACAITMMILFWFLLPSIEINATTDSQAALSVREATGRRFIGFSR